MLWPDSLQPQRLEHARPPCLSLYPGVCSNSCPLSQWCHSTISSPVVPFSCLQSFPASGPFPMSQFFASGGQSIGGSVSVTSPSNEYSGLISFRINWFDLLAVQETLRVFSKNTRFKSINFSVLGFVVQFAHPYITRMNKQQGHEYSRGNCNQYSETKHNRKEYEKEHIYTCVCITFLYNRN